ncbi:MAG: hypothetical protein CBB72_002225 [Muricauda sp. TMED12]|nr:MAG: hypothetical protein CBB72_002225 [Muricauda sp. TMED12]
MTIDYEKLLEDIELKMWEHGLNQKDAAAQMGLAPGIFRRLKNYKQLYLETYLKIINWLRADLKEYLI